MAQVFPVPFCISAICSVGSRGCCIPTNQRAANEGISLFFGYYHEPVMRQLFDVVYQAIQLPLRIDLAPAAQGETVEEFVFWRLPNTGSTAEKRGP